jgi:hypothetical protein
MPSRELSDSGLDLLLTDIIVWPIRVAHCNTPTQTPAHTSRPMIDSTSTRTAG